MALTCTIAKSLNVIESEFGMSRCHSLTFVQCLQFNKQFLHVSQKIGCVHAFGDILIAEMKTESTKQHIVYNCYRHRRCFGHVTFSWAPSKNLPFEMVKRNACNEMSINVNSRTHSDNDDDNPHSVASFHSKRNKKRLASASLLWN